MKRRSLIAGTAALALGGCGLSERPYLQRTQWPLLVTRPVSLPPRPGGRVLLVRAIRAAPGLGVRGLQTLRANGSMETGFYEEWLVPPAEAIENDLRLWMAASGLFSAVLAPGSRLAADLVMEGELTAFWADPAAQRARVALGIVLLNQSRVSDAVTIVLQRTFTADPPLGRTDAASIVAALRTGLADVLGQIEAATGAGIGQARVASTG